MTDASPAPIEVVWLVEATYAPDGAEARVPFRAEHIARLQRLRAEGIVIEAGAFTDVSSTVMIVRAKTEEDVLALARDDVYMRNGVWVEIRVRPFGRVRDQSGT
ncbi:MAG: YciI family protein [Chloroflexota bacterium]